MVNSYYSLSLDLGEKDNTVLNLKALTLRDLQERQGRREKVNPVFYKQLDDLSKNEIRWYEKSNHPESWAKTPLKSGTWILTPVSVPDDTTSSNYQEQQTLIGRKYHDYIQGSALELVSHLALNEGVTGVRHYANSYGWTSMASEPAPVGAFPWQFVNAGNFNDVGFKVAINHPVLSDDALGAFLLWNFRD